LVLTKSDKKRARLQGVKSGYLFGKTQIEASSSAELNQSRASLERGNGLSQNRDADNGPSLPFAGSSLTGFSFTAMA
jgi:hypothetical protein